MIESYGLNAIAGLFANSIRSAAAVVNGEEYEVSISGKSVSANECSVTIAVQPNIFTQYGDVDEIRLYNSSHGLMARRNIHLESGAAGETIHYRYVARFNAEEE